MPVAIYDHVQAEGNDNNEARAPMAVFDQEDKQVGPDEEHGSALQGEIG